MLENLLFSLSRVTPFFLLILLGMYFRARGKVTETFFQLANDFVYKVALPIHLFHTIASPAEESSISARFLGFVILATLGAFAAVWGASELFCRDKTQVGTVVQAGFRGNFALLGIPVVSAVAGAAAAQKAAFAVMAVIPLYNLLSVVVLMLRGKATGKPDFRKILRGIVTNPLIVAILLALPLFSLGVRLPYAVDETLDFVGRIATPLGLLSIGGLFRLSDAAARLKPTLFATFLKLVAQPLVILPLAYLAGFRGEELLIMLVLFAAPCAVSSYPMACAMGGDGPLAAGALILTTFLSSFVFAAGIYAMRTLGLL